jgi:3-methyladenine DNA glycosylase AlkD|tara:strand:+ start:2032 stop:2178 length:147 start_codon:yes stop_codon:yes gene_type:complete
MKSLQELIKENKSVANLWEEYLTLYNYVDNKMVEGCNIAEKILTKINE